MIFNYWLVKLKRISLWGSGGLEISRTQDSKANLLTSLPIHHLAMKALLITLAVDHSFENSFYINGSILYNSASQINPGLQQNVNLFGQERLTAKSLSPFRYATFVQTSYNFHPLINGGLSAIYYPSKRDALFINPTISLSLKSNLDLNLISQLYFDSVFDNYGAQARLFFLRMKWSF